MSKTWDILRGSTVIATVHELEYHGEWMEDEYVSVTIKSESPVNLKFNDYLMYRGTRFEINYDPNVIKKSSSGTYGEGFVYDGVKLYSEAAHMKRMGFRDYVLNWNSQSNKLVYSSQGTFSFFAATIDDFADRLQANLNRLESEWMVFTQNRSRDYTRHGNDISTITLYEKYYHGISYDGSDSEAEKDVNVSVDNVTCWDALKLAYTQFGVSYYIKGKHIVIEGAPVDSGRDFGYGKGNGLYEIERTTDDSQRLVTKLFAYGSEKNIPTNYYANLHNVAYVTGHKFQWSIISDRTIYSVLTGLTKDSVSGKAPSGKEVTLKIGPSTINGWIDYRHGVKSIDEQGSEWESDPESEEYLRVNFGEGSSAESFMRLITNDYTRIYFTSGINVNTWPNVENQAAGQQNYPALLSINRLMLPGFPDQSLYSWVTANGGTAIDASTGKAAWHGYTAYFSKDKKDPWVMSVKSDEYGVHEGTVNFDGNSEDEICPTIEGTGYDVVSTVDTITDNGYLDGDDDTFELVPAKVNGSTGDIEWDYSGDTVSISMKDGPCVAREFVVKKAKYKTYNGSSSKVWVLTLERSKDSSLGVYFPYRYDGDMYQVKSGNHFVVLGIPLPKSYVDIAAKNLLEKALKKLSKTDHMVYTYIPKIDEIEMAREHDRAASGKSLHDNLFAGMQMTFHDDNLGIEESPYIGQLTIKENGNNGIPTYDVVLRDEKEETFEERIISRVGGSGSSGSSGGSTKGGTGSGSGISEEELEELMGGYVTTEFFEKLFSVHKKVNITEDITVDEEIEVNGEIPEEGELSIESKMGLWTEQFLSALGTKGDEEEGFSLNLPLSEINQLGYNPTDDGQTLVFKNGGWTYGKSETELTSILQHINQNSPYYIEDPSDGQTLVYDEERFQWRYGSAGLDVTQLETYLSTHQILTLGDDTYSPNTPTIADYLSTKEYLTKTDADGIYITIAFFKKLFQPQNGSASIADADYNNVNATITSIKAMVGLWTDEYLSALGTQGSGSGDSFSLYGVLKHINEHTSGTPTPSIGDTIIFSGGSWGFGQAGVDAASVQTAVNTALSGKYWWGRQFVGDTVTGDMSSVGDITFSASGKSIGEMLRFDTASSQIRVNDYQATDGGVRQFTYGNGTFTPRLYIDGNIGVTNFVFADGIELHGSSTTNNVHGGHIDFHYNKSTLDFTSRIIELSSGVLSIMAMKAESGTPTLTPSSLVVDKLYLYKDSSNASNDVYFVKDSTGVKLVGAGFYTDSFISALGTSGSTSGGVFDLTSMWNALTNYDNNSSHKINSSYLNLSGYAKTSDVTHTLTIKESGKADVVYDGTADKEITINAGTASGDCLNPRAIAIGSDLGAFYTESDLTYGWVSGNNGVEDRPTGVDAFGVIALRTAYGYHGQILLSSGNEMFFRSQGTFDGGWKKVLTDSDLSAYTKTSDFQSLTVKAGTNDVVAYNPTGAKTLTFTAATNSGISVTGSANTITIGYTIPIATSSVLGGIKVGSTLAIANELLNLKSGIVTEGTYRSVTVDTYGRVTAGTNPTTLAGYGILPTDDLFADITAGTANKITNGDYAMFGNQYILAGVPQTINNAPLTGVTSITMSGALKMAYSQPIKMYAKNGSSNADYNVMSLSPRELVNNQWAGDCLIIGYGSGSANVETRLFGEAIRFYTYNSNSSDYAQRLTILNGGDVGIGVTVPQYKLDVNGSIRATRFYLHKGSGTSDSDVYFMYDNNGGVKLVGAGFYTESFISALGTKDTSSGDLFNETTMWQKLGTTILEKKIPQSSINMNGILMTANLGTLTLKDSSGSVLGTWKANTTNEITITGGVSGDYLPLTIPDGGKTVSMPGINSAVTFKNTGSSYPLIRFEGKYTENNEVVSKGLGFLGIGRTQNGDVVTLEPYYVTADSNGAYTDGTSQWNILLHTGNYTKYVVSSLGTSGDYVTWTKNGAVNNLTVPYATYTKRLGQTTLADGESLATFIHSTDLIYTAKGGSNNCTDKPSADVDSFGIISFKTASLYYGQILLSDNLYFRRSNNLSGGWRQVLDSSNCATVLSGKVTNAMLAGSIAKEKLLNYSVTVNGTSVDLGGSITTTKWGTERNISIASSDGTGSGTAVGVNGSEAVTLKLPSTIKASLIGNADTATKLASKVKLWGNDFDGSAGIGYNNSNRASLSYVDAISMSGDITTGGSIKMNQGQYIKVNIDGTYREIIGAWGTGYNLIQLGYNSATYASYATNIYGNKLRLYGSSTHQGIYIDTSGNVCVGHEPRSNSYKLNVNGTVKATKYYLTDSVYFEYTSSGVKLVGAGFYTESFVSALGTSSSSSGSGVDLSAVWNSLSTNTDSYKNIQINASHLSSALSGFASQTWVQSNAVLNIKMNGSTLTKTNGVVDLGTIGGGSVNSVKVGTTSYTPSSGVVSLPAYPSDFVSASNGGTFAGSVSITKANTALYLGVNCGASAPYNLKVSGATYLDGNLSVSGTSTLTGNVLAKAMLTVGQGTQNTGYTLYVSGSSYISGALTVNNNLYAKNKLTVGGDEVSSSSENAILEVDTNNNLSITTGSDIYLKKPVHFGSYSNVYIKSATSTSGSQTIYALDLYCTIARINGSTTITSDMRKKDVVSFIDNLNVDNIALAPIFNFKWKDSTDGLMAIGTSAQYWRSFLPNAVFEFDDVLSLDYNAVSLASAVITARKVVDHEERIKALEQENEWLRTEIELLKAA